MIPPVQARSPYCGACFGGMIHEGSMLGTSEDFTFEELKQFRRDHYMQKCIDQRCSQFGIVFDLINGWEVKP